MNFETRSVRWKEDKLSRLYLNFQIRHEMYIRGGKNEPEMFMVMVDLVVTTTW